MDWKKLNNEELLRLYGKGEFQAFEEFFKRNSHSVFLFVLSRTGNQVDSEEIIQETFFRLHKYIHRYDPNKSAINWVFTIAKNQMLTHLSKKVDTLELDESLVESRRTSSMEAKDELEKMLGRLSEEEKTLILDKFLNEEDYEEISRKRGLTAVNARKKVSRILKKIRST